MTKAICGKVYVLGDNVDTDQIIPAKYLNLVPTIPDELVELGSHAMAGLPDDCPAFVAPGALKAEYSIVIAGENFGCGSSREHAPVSMAAAGIEAVVALSYARIFLRNAVATGDLFPCECAERLCDVFHTGESAELDLEAGRIVHVELGMSDSLGPLPEAPVIAAGGIFKYAREIGLI